MNTDRFGKYGNDVRSLVLDFESMHKRGDEQFYDVDEFEVIIDYYLEENDFEWLESAVSYAEKLYPDDPEIRLRRSHLYCANGQYDRAKAILDDLERIEPENTDVQYALGALYSSTDNPRKAIQYYLKASTDGYELGMVYGNVADEYYKLGELDESVRYYKKSIAANHNEDRSLYNLSSLWAENGRFEEAVGYFERFLDEEPYSAEGWACLANIHFDQGDWEAAIDAYKYLLVIDQKRSSAYLDMSNCYCNLKQYAQAVSVLRESLEFASDKSYVYYSIGRIYGHCRNFESAVIYYRKAIELDNSFADAYMSVSRCYSQMNDYGTAVDFANRALAVNPKSPLYVWETARLHDRFDNVELADSLYDCAVQLDPEDEMMRVDYAEFLVRHADYDKAIALLGDGLVNASVSLPYHVLLAVCYYRTGRRNFLFNAIRACQQHLSDQRLEDLFYLCPEILMDPEVLNILNSK